MAKRNIFRGLAAVLALGMCMTGLAGCGSEKRADGKTEMQRTHRYLQEHSKIPLLVGANLEEIGRAHV